MPNQNITMYLQQFLEPYPFPYTQNILTKELMETSDSNIFSSMKKAAGKSVQNHPKSIDSKSIVLFMILKKIK